MVFWSVSGGSGIHGRAGARGGGGVSLEIGAEAATEIGAGTGAKFGTRGESPRG